MKSMLDLPVSSFLVFSGALGSGVLFMPYFFSSYGYATTMAVLLLMCAYNTLAALFQIVLFLEEKHKGRMPEGEQSLLTVANSCGSPWDTIVCLTCQISNPLVALPFLNKSIGCLSESITSGFDISSPYSLHVKLLVAPATVGTLFLLQTCRFSIFKRFIPTICTTVIASLIGMLYYIDSTVEFSKPEAPEAGGPEKSWMVLFSDLSLLIFATSNQFFTTRFYTFLGTDSLLLGLLSNGFGNFLVFAFFSLLGILGFKIYGAGIQQDIISLMSNSSNPITKQVLESSLLSNFLINSVRILYPLVWISASYFNTIDYFDWILGSPRKALWLCCTFTLLTAFGLIEKSTFNIDSILSLLGCFSIPLSSYAFAFAEVYNRRRGWWALGSVVLLGLCVLIMALGLISFAYENVLVFFIGKGV